MIFPFLNSPMSNVFSFIMLVFLGETYNAVHGIQCGLFCRYYVSTFGVSGDDETNMWPSHCYRLASVFSFWFRYYYSFLNGARLFQALTHCFGEDIDFTIGGFARQCIGLF